ncbi:hypothetical protein FRUB_00784 [Fimbriiglobus ruber]|uniref:Uncharacterized protein n=1 Tax=Fimbriiglobus ruber TaxID=1908690 RepID=A0A225EFF4_9BACT|nr:hypothetical protein FRUB_00784 [Fimbriiglobus ruber]
MGGISDVRQDVQVSPLVNHVLAYARPTGSSSGVPVDEPKLSL